MMPRTTAILRGHDPQFAADLAEQCWTLGFDLVEVPVQDGQGWAALAAVSERSGGRVFGAGTILSAHEVNRAVDLGASVIISPGLDSEVVQAAQNTLVEALPGVMTPTEVSQAATLGVRAAKLFPATVVGPRWLRALKGPFPAMAFIAVGGITPTNAHDFISAGAGGVAFGNSIETLLANEAPAGFIQEIHELIGSVSPRVSAGG